MHNARSSACMELPKFIRTHVHMRNSRTARRLYIKFGFREFHEEQYGSSQYLFIWAMFNDSTWWPTFLSVCIWLTNQPSNSTELSPSWDSVSCSSTQEFPTLWKLKFDYRVHKNPPLVPILSFMKLLHISASHLSDTPLNILPYSYVLVFLVITFLLALLSECLSSNI
jgi:hypothetical protein